MATTVHEDLQNQLVYDGVKEWHEKGITGKGVMIWNMENNQAEHGQMSTIRVKHSAPESKVINATLSMSYNGKVVHESNAILNDGTKIPTEEFIKKNNIKILTRSVGGSFSGGASTKFWKELQDKYKLTIFNSYGNEGTGSGTENDEVAILVGACGLGADGKPRRDNYSSTGKGIDFIDFRGFYSGTSFSAPYLAGKAALLVQKYGHQITQDEVYEYFKDHAEDLDAEGKDNYTGWGLPIMGKTETIIKMQIGNKVMDVDGRKVTLDQEPIIKNSRTLVPLRAISESLGAKVEWGEPTKTITIER